MNRSVRVSSMVDFTPSLAATTACTLGSWCSSSALNASSVLEKANVSLPVVGLIFIGGSTLNSLSVAASLWLDMSWSLSTIVTASNNDFFPFCMPIKWLRSKSAFKYSVGSENMRIVRSIRRNSDFGNSADRCLNRS